jgi:hypothetical protein
MRLGKVTFTIDGFIDLFMTWELFAIIIGVRFHHAVPSR